MFRPDLSQKTKIAAIKNAGIHLCLYRNLKEDPIFKSFLALVDLLNQDKPAPEELIESYYYLSYQLLGITSPDGFTGDSWQYHLINMILRDENPFSRGIEVYGFEGLENNVKHAAAGDLIHLQILAAAEAKTIKNYVKHKLFDMDYGKQNISFENWPGWGKSKNKPVQVSSLSSFTLLADTLLKSENWADLVPEIANFYRNNGVGVFGLYGAFRWMPEPRACLRGVEHPDFITFDDIIGYHSQQKVIIDNTESFLKNLPANNILLYGERGTGKSSSVKALLPAFESKGLRLVEVSKQDLSEFPLILQLLGQRTQKFIIFIDDLSFNENEVEYRYLKALLEGGLEAIPNNIIIYATSNRRHLISEKFSDQDSIIHDDEIRIMDTRQEKLSLADRFGMTLTFTSPSQTEYLAIVTHLIKKAGLNIDKSESERLAIQWELKYNGRSGRTARQFVNWLIGEKKKKMF